MSNYTLSFYRQINSNWVLMSFFADLRFKDLQECDDFALNFLENKRKRKNIVDLLRYKIEET